PDLTRGRDELANPAYQPERREPVERRRGLASGVERQLLGVILSDATHSGANLAGADASAIIGTWAPALTETAGAVSVSTAAVECAVRFGSRAIRCLPMSP
ncbi:MAG: hypothetical protein M0014_01165, partial [Actinomycetota bacterium]|nr:hypothetical protein [Actinomycetota bacterium]